MCTRRDDKNVIRFAGTADGTKAFYQVNGQNRLEIMLSCRNSHGTTRMVAQFRGEKADDAFLLYQRGREFAVDGRIKYRSGGRFCIVVEDFGVGNRKGKATVEDLFDKINAIRLKVASEPVTPDEEYTADELEVNNLATESGGLRLEPESPMGEPGFVFAKPDDESGVPVEVNEDDIGKVSTVDIFSDPAIEVRNELDRINNANPMGEIPADD